MAKYGFYFHCVIAKMFTCQQMTVVISPDSTTKAAFFTRKLHGFFGKICHHFLSKLELHKKPWRRTPKSKKRCLCGPFSFCILEFPFMPQQTRFFFKKVGQPFFCKWILDIYKCPFFKSPEYFGQLFFGVFFSCFVCFSLSTFL